MAAATNILSDTYRFEPFFNRSTKYQILTVRDVGERTAAAEPLVFPSPDGPAL